MHHAHPLIRTASAYGAPARWGTPVVAAAQTATPRLSGTIATGTAPAGTARAAPTVRDAASSRYYRGARYDTLHAPARPPVPPLRIDDVPPTAVGAVKPPAAAAPRPADMPAVPTVAIVSPPNQLTDIMDMPAGSPVTASASGPVSATDSVGFMRSVAEFHRAFGHPAAERPDRPRSKTPR